MGDRKRRLLKAVAELGRLPATKVLRRSLIYETAAIGPSRRPYLNLALRIRTRLSAAGLLVEAKRLEASAGRRPGPRWGPRPLDIDIVSYGRKKIRTAWLMVPHPRVAQRAFALAPLADIAPAFRPAGKSAVAALLRRLNPDSGTVKIYSTCPTKPKKPRS